MIMSEETTSTAELTAKQFPLAQCDKQQTTFEKKSEALVSFTNMNGKVTLD